MFQASVIRCPIKLKVVEVARNVREVVEARAKKMLEGICSYVGYAKPGSLRLLQMGPGVLSGIDMGRHFTFQCTFAAEVCNPAPGTRLKAYVRSVNRFGALVEGGYIDHMGTLVPVIELVVIRDPTIAKNEVDVADLAPGDEVGVEVLGRRFELRDTRIAGFGRTVLDVGGGADDTPAGPLRSPSDGVSAEGTAGTGRGASGSPGSGPVSGSPGSEATELAAASAASASTAAAASAAAATAAASAASASAADASAADGESDGGSEGGLESGSDGGSDGDEDGDSDASEGRGADDDDDDLVSWAEEEDPVAPDDEAGYAGDSGDAGDAGEIAEDSLVEADEGPVGVGRR